MEYELNGPDADDQGDGLTVFKMSIPVSDVDGIADDPQEVLSAAFRFHRDHGVAVCCALEHMLAVAVVSEDVSPLDNLMAVIGDMTEHKHALYPTLAAMNSLVREQTDVGRGEIADEPTEAYDEIIAWAKAHTNADMERLFTDTKITLGRRISHSLRSMAVVGTAMTDGYEAFEPGDDD